MSSPTSQEDFITNRPSNTPTSLGGPEYRIGKDDLIEITMFEIPELGSTPRVTAAGTISLPLLGPMEAAGHTPQELERSIEEALKRNFVNDPHVTVFVREYVGGRVHGTRTAVFAIPHGDLLIGTPSLPGRRPYYVKAGLSCFEMLSG